MTDAGSCPASMVPRPRPLALGRAAIARALSRAPRLEVATDFDGTLTPIVSHPDRAGLPHRARRLLEWLASLPEARVALLSGRPLRDLELRFRRSRIFLSGAAGLESRDERGRRSSMRSALPKRLVTELERWCARFDGAWLERKGAAVAAHARAVRPSRRGAFGRGVRRIAAAFRGRVTLERGKQVYELRPVGAPTKADAVARWLGRSARSMHRAGPPRAARRALFYFGDDANDEPAFARVRDLGGFTVVVGRRRSAAEFRLGTPQAVVEFLEWLGDAWEARVAGAPRAGPPRPRGGERSRQPG